MFLGNPAFITTMSFTVDYKLVLNVYLFIKTAQKELYSSTRINNSQVVLIIWAELL